MKARTCLAIAVKAVDDGSTHTHTRTTRKRSRVVGWGRRDERPAVLSWDSRTVPYPVPPSLLSSDTSLSRATWVCLFATTSSLPRPSYHRARHAPFSLSPPHFPALPRTTFLLHFRCPLLLGVFSLYPVPVFSVWLRATPALRVALLLLLFCRYGRVGLRALLCLCLSVCLSLCCPHRPEFHPWSPPRTPHTSTHLRPHNTQTQSHTQTPHTHVQK